ncbi:D-aminoacyl-tRNA deacylase, partial [candidate division WWE3 bacterium]|nr:D-aminoacyl-tRNA deacylase [candidate division WWE3 bacterium]
ADTSQRRPSFLNARTPAEAEVLFNHFADKVQTSGLKVATGVFGAYMEISSVNNGPVTIILDT